MRRHALLALIGVFAALGPAAKSATPDALPPFGYPLRQALDCAGKNLCPGDRFPAFSPDGSQIAFIRNGGAGLELMVMNSDGTNVAMVAENAALEPPVWADKQTIYYGCGQSVCSTESDLGAPGPTKVISPSDALPESVPVLSPDGKTMVTVARLGPPYAVQGNRLIVMDTAGGRRLVLGGAQGDSWWSPTWSPDGTQLAFARGATAVDGALWVVNADGSNAHAVAGTHAITSVEGWQTGGRIFVIDTEHDLLTVSAAGGDVQVGASGTVVFASLAANSALAYLTSATDGEESLVIPTQDPLLSDRTMGRGVSVQARPEATSFSWSPTVPVRLAYTSDGDCPTLIGIYVVPVEGDGTNAKRVSEQCRRNGTAHGDRLTGTAGIDAPYGLGGADTIDAGAGNDFVDGGAGNDTVSGGPGDDRLIGGPGQDVISGGDGWDAIVSRDGERDHVACGPGRDIVWADPIDVVAPDCDVVVRQQIATFPTAGRIAFSCDDCNPPAIRTISPGGGAARLATTSTFVISTPRWSPDGRTLAYALGNTIGAIWLHRAGARDRRLPVPTTDIPTWFPDGTLLITNRHGSATTFSKVTVAGKVESRFTVGWRASSPELSHDGRRIALDDAHRVIWTINVNGTSRTRIASGYAPRWSADDKRLAYIDENGLHTIDLAGGATQDVVAGDGYPFAVAWAPKGPWLVAEAEHDYDCGDPTGPCSEYDLWVVNANTGAEVRIYRGPDSLSGVDWR